MNNQLAEKILRAYNLAWRTILPAQSGYRNTAYPVLLANETTINLIVYKSEPGMLQRIARTNRVSNFAAKHMPARRSYDPRILAIQSGAKTTYAALYHYLPGLTIPWEAYSMKHLKVLGKTMSDLHDILKRYPGELPSVATENLLLNRRMLRYFFDPHVIRALRHKLGLMVQRADYQKLLRACDQLPGQQALHMDLVRGNVLFDNATVTGILDFEKTAYGHPLFDIARTLAFLLVDCKYKQPQKVRKYFLQSGYHKRGAMQLTPIAIGSYDVLQELTDFFLLHDFYKFLRHNPYESLHQNKHFVRTKLMLLKRGLIANVNVRIE